MEHRAFYETIEAERESRESLFVIQASRSRTQA
jgi:hypothetical protein